MGAVRVDRWLVATGVLGLLCPIGGCTHPDKVVVRVRLRTSKHSIGQNPPERCAGGRPEHDAAALRLGDMATALVTGASSGIGKEFAWQLAGAGHDLVLVARRAATLATIARQIRAAANVQVEVLVADLSKLDEVQTVAQRLADPDRPISLLVNNAGVSTGSFLRRDIDSLLNSLDVLVRAPFVLSRAAAAAMVSRGVGAILNVGSVAGNMTTSPYSAHKAWLQVFTEALASELAGTGVQAMVLRPGPVKTEFFANESRGQAMFPAWAWIGIEQLVETALADLRAGKTISTPTVRYRISAALMQILPRPVVWRISGLRRSWRKQR